MNFSFRSSGMINGKRCGTVIIIHLDHTHQQVEELMKDKKFGTVGAVACDVNGNIAAATSTGGMTNKKYGRIGDSPLIGIGTYANNKTCAISCTGHGEPFIRAVAAHDVSCLMEYKGMSLQEAMNEVVNKNLPNIRRRRRHDRCGCQRKYGADF